MAKDERNDRVLEMVRGGSFDYLDFGTHKGGGLRVGRELGGVAGLGVELQDDKVKELFQRGAFAYSGNVLEFPDAANIRFAVCSHVLEHMPSIFEIGTVINKLAAICQDFIFIRQPSFDSQEQLFERGLKMAHFTMKHHDCRITVRQFVDMMWDLRLERFVIGGALPYASSDSSWFHSTAGRKNVGKWTTNDPPKPSIKFSRPVHRDIVLCIALRPDVDLMRVAKAGGMTQVFMESTQMEHVPDMPWPVG
ncbi:MAG: hypothetical protein EON87_12610 [Brevundimonas sp.]|nr:MAG: hypothetical protein EON87_12610 [Brevundimonas sp.]